MRTNTISIANIEECQKALRSIMSVAGYYERPNASPLPSLLFDTLNFATCYLLYQLATGNENEKRMATPYIVQLCFLQIISIMLRKAYYIFQEKSPLELLALLVKIEKSGVKIPENILTQRGTTNDGSIQICTAISLCRSETFVRDSESLPQNYQPTAVIDTQLQAGKIYVIDYPELSKAAQSLLGALQVLKQAAHTGLNTQSTAAANMLPHHP